MPTRRGLRDVSRVRWPGWPRRVHFTWEEACRGVGDSTGGVGDGTLPAPRRGTQGVAWVSRIAAHQGGRGPDGGWRKGACGTAFRRLAFVASARFACFCCLVGSSSLLTPCSLSPSRSHGPWICRAIQGRRASSRCTGKFCFERIGTVQSNSQWDPSASGIIRSANKQEGKRKQRE